MFFQLDLQDRDGRFKFRRVDADGQPGGEAADQAFLQPFDLSRMPVGSQADLLLVVNEFVEDVEERFMTLFLAGQKLDIVDQQDVQIVHFFFEFLNLAVFDGIDDSVDEVFAGRVVDFFVRRVFADIVTDRV